MRKRYKINNDKTELVSPAVAHFREEIPALVAAVACPAPPFASASKNMNLVSTIVVISRISCY